MKYKIVIVETMFGKQFSTIVESESEKEAINRGYYPICNAFEEKED